MSSSALSTATVESKAKAKKATKVPKMAKKTRGGESVRQHAQENSAIELDDIQLQNAQTEGQSTKGQSTKGQSAKGQSTEGQRSEKAPRRIELFTYCAESLKELRETYGLEGVTYGDKITKGAEIEGLIKYLNDNGFDNIESICSYNGMVAAAYILCRWIRPSELRLIAEKLKVNNFKVYKGTVELSFKNDSERARFVGRLGMHLIEFTNEYNLMYAWLSNDELRVFGFNKDQVNAALNGVRPQRKSEPKILVSTAKDNWGVPLFIGPEQPYVAPTTYKPRISKPLAIKDKDGNLVKGGGKKKMATTKKVTKKAAKA